MIAQGRRLEEDTEKWFEKLVHQFDGERVKLIGSFPDLSRIASIGAAKGLKCSFAPDLILQGGMKGLKEAPEKWREVINGFFGITIAAGVYGMSECTGAAPRCSQGFYHFMPYMVPILLDADGQELPRLDVQTGRLAIYDPLAVTRWGGFISGDQLTIHWDEDCACGWKGPRAAAEIRRFAEMEGGDDKITCAGTAEVYNEFMSYVAQV